MLGIYACAAHTLSLSHSLAPFLLIFKVFSSSLLALSFPQLFRLEIFLCIETNSFLKQRKMLIEQIYRTKPILRQPSNSLLMIEVLMIQSHLSNKEMTLRIAFSAHEIGRYSNRSTLILCIPYLCPSTLWAQYINSVTDSYFNLAFLFTPSTNFLYNHVLYLLYKHYNLERSLNIYFTASHRVSYLFSSEFVIILNFIVSNSFSDLWLSFLI